MKVTFANETTLTNVVNVEELLSPRMERATTLSIRMRTDKSVDELKSVFTPEATASITVDDGDTPAVIEGYTVVDSIRRFWDGRAEYNATVDLVKAGSEA